MQIFVAAVKEAGSFDPEKIREALASITVETITGLYKANEIGKKADVEHERLLSARERKSPSRGSNFRS